MVTVEIREAVMSQKTRGEVTEVVEAMELRGMTASKMATVALEHKGTMLIRALVKTEQMRCNSGRVTKATSGAGALEVTGQRTSAHRAKVKFKVC